MEFHLAKEPKRPKMKNFHLSNYKRLTRILAQNKVLYKHIMSYKSAYRKELAEDSYQKRRVLGKKMEDEMEIGRIQPSKLTLGYYMLDLDNSNVSPLFKKGNKKSTKKRHQGRRKKKHVQSLSSCSNAKENKLGRLKIRRRKMKPKALNYNSLDQIHFSNKRDKRHNQNRIHIHNIASPQSYLTTQASHKKLKNKRRNSSEVRAMNFSDIIENHQEQGYTLVGENSFEQPNQDSKRAIKSESKKSYKNYINLKEASEINLDDCEQYKFRSKTLCEEMSDRVEKVFRYSSRKNLTQVGPNSIRKIRGKFNDSELELSANRDLSNCRAQFNQDSILPNIKIDLKQDKTRSEVGILDSTSYINGSNEYIQTPQKLKEIRMSNRRFSMAEPKRQYSKRSKPKDTSAFTQESTTLLSQSKTNFQNQSITQVNPSPSNQQSQDHLHHLLKNTEGYYTQGKFITIMSPN